jgi:hypothetical protein
MVIKNCLSFLHEEFDANCLKPFQVVINSSQYDRTKVDFSIKNGLKSGKKICTESLFVLQPGFKRFVQSTKRETCIIIEC